MSRTTAQLQARLAELEAARDRDEAYLAALRTCNAEKLAALEAFKAACPGTFAR